MHFSKIYWQLRDELAVFSSGDMWESKWIESVCRTSFRGQSIFVMQSGGINQIQCVKETKVYLRAL